MGSRDSIELWLVAEKQYLNHFMANEGKTHYREGSDVNETPLAVLYPADSAYV